MEGGINVILSQRDTEKSDQPKLGVTSISHILFHRDRRLTNTLDLVLENTTGKPQWLQISFPGAAEEVYLDLSEKPPNDPLVELYPRFCRYNGTHQFFKEVLNVDYKRRIWEPMRWINVRELSLTPNSGDSRFTLEQEIEGESKIPYSLYTLPEAFEPGETYALRLVIKNSKEGLGIDGSKMAIIDGPKIMMDLIEGYFIGGVDDPKDKCKFGQQLNSIRQRLIVPYQPEFLFHVEAKEEEDVLPIDIRGGCRFFPFGWLLHNRRNRIEDPTSLSGNFIFPDIELRKWLRDELHARGIKGYYAQGDDYSVNYRFKG